MRQIQLHTNEWINGLTARNEMRFSGSLSSVGLCADFAKSNYQPKLTSGIDCRVNKI